MKTIALYNIPQSNKSSASLRLTEVIDFLCLDIALRSSTLLTVG